MTGKLFEITVVVTAKLPVHNTVLILRTDRQRPTVSRPQLSLAGNEVF